MKPIYRISILTIVVAVSQPLAAQTWNGTTNANWSVTTNWNPNAVPAEGSNIIIANATTNGLALNDGSHLVGSVTIGTTGTRTSGFTFQTNTVNTLTISGGVVANGNFTGGTGARFRGNTVISVAQDWLVGGQEGSHAADRGIAFNEVSSGVVGSVALNANLSKFGTGQLTMAGVSVSGVGDVNVNDGSLKLNAAANAPLTVGGTGKIVVNNTAMLILSQNSGTFAVSRPFQFNLGAKLVTGSGTNNKTGDFTIASNMEWNGIHTITNNNDNDNVGDVRFIFTGVMSGAGTITKAGPRRLELAGTSSNTISTDVTIAAGELRLNKTGATAIPGNILITGGMLSIAQNDQITDTSGITVTSGQIGYTAGRTETIASLNISSGGLSSVAGLTVTGATTITAGTQELDSGETFTTDSLSISNNAILRFEGNNPIDTFSIMNVGAGGLILNNGRVHYGDAGDAGTSQFNLAGNVVSTGTSSFTATNYIGPRILDLQAGSRSFAVNDGSLNIQTTVQNGTLVKSGSGTLILSRTGSTADFSFTEGTVGIATQVNAGNITHSAGPLLIDIGGGSPAKITTTGNYTYSNGSIEISANNGVVAAGTHELVRYGGALSGIPTINIPAELATSRMDPMVSYGSGNDSAITITSAAVPLGIVWDGSTGGIWDNHTTANFNSAAETFYSLDTVTFDDTGANSSIVLDSIVFPNGVVFNHGDTVTTYTLSGTGSISGSTTLTKTGTGTTILATNNDYTGATNILNGVLQVGNGGAIGSLGSGAVFVDGPATLEFNRNDSTVVANLFTGSGTILHSGTGTVALTGNSTTFSGFVDITAGTLQLGNGGTSGSLGNAPVYIAGGATFATSRSDLLILGNYLSGEGSLLVSTGDVNMSTLNNHEGGVTVNNGGTIRLTEDGVLGAVPANLVADHIVLNYGGLKNQNSFAWVHSNRGITISGEAYFTADWSKEISIESAITGTGDIFINYDSGKVIFTDTTSDWDGVLTLGAAKPGSFGTTGGILEINTINNGGVAGPLGIASADPANLVFNGGRLTYTGTTASTDRGFTLQGAGTIDVSFDTLTMSGQATGSGNFIKAGTGTLVLSNPANNLAGEKIVSAGTLVSAATTALGDTAMPVRFTGTTGILDLATDTSVAPYPFTIGVNNSGTILSNVATPGNPGINHTLGDFSLSRITVNVAAGANVAGGDPRVTIPNLSLSSGDPGTTVLAPTTANITLGTATIGSGNAAKTLSLAGTAMDSHVTGIISDGINVLTLNKTNNSLWTISGDNTFTGNASVTDGVLTITHSNALGAATKTVFAFGNASNAQFPELRFSGGISPTFAEVQTSGAGDGSATGVLRNISGNNTLNITNQLTMRTGVGATTLYSDDGTFTINTPLVTANATNRALFLAGPGDGVINAVIANGSTTNLPVTKNGTGTWTLNGAHTYTGTTTVNEGILSLGQAALDDNSAVVIGENGVLDLAFDDIDQVASLTIGNDPPLPNDVYSAATHPGIITGDGSIRVGPAPSGYATWTAGFPFTVGVNDGENDDPDDDGISNLLEYVLGGVPVGPGASDTSILPTQVLTDTDIEFTFFRSDASETDVTLKVEWSETLDVWNDFVTIGAGDDLPAVDVTEDSPNDDLDTVKVTIPRDTSTSGMLFIRLEAVK